MSAFKERAYQLEVSAALLAAQARDLKRGLVILPTGLGKTVSLTRAPSILGISKPDVTLIIAHRGELIEQTVRKVQGWDPSTWVEVEMAERRASAMSEVVVASVQSLQGSRLEDFLVRFARRIKLLIVDEAHHATAQSYRTLIERVLEERPDAMVIGFTATPNRSDKTGLSAVFDEVVYHRDIKWAIHDGYLVPVSCWRVRTKTSLDAVKVNHGEFSQHELSDAVNNDARNDMIVSAYSEYTPGKKAIVFCVDVAHAHALAARFRGAGINAAFAHGGTPKHERAEILRDFKSGKISVLANCSLWTEGFDEPSVEVVIGARPTKSSLLYTQMAGRGLRPLDEVSHRLGPDTTAEQRRHAIETSAKPQAVILDIVDQAHKHSLISFPTLWGLPAKLDPKGKRITEVAKKYDELAERDPDAAKRIDRGDRDTGYEFLDTLIERIDQFAVPKLDPVVSENAQMSWMLVSNDTYRLRLPPENRAKGKGAKADGPEVREFIEISTDVLGAAEVAIVRNDEHKVLGKTDDLPSAFQRAEAWITKARPAVRKVLDRHAPWRAIKPSAGQIALLEKFGTPASQMPRTRGEASTLIEHLLGRKKVAS
jgi:ATP-dependent helicase IRC3